MFIFKCSWVLIIFLKPYFFCLILQDKEIQHEYYYFLLLIVINIFSNLNIDLYQDPKLKKEYLSIVSKGRGVVNVEFYKKMFAKQRKSEREKIRGRKSD